MSGEGNAANQGPAHRVVELATAGAIGLFAVIVIYGAVQAGTGWGFEGPKAGFFPFYIGLIILFATGVNLWLILREPDTHRIFADWGQLKQVAAVAGPTAIFITAIYFIGIYVSAVFLIAYFMRWLSKNDWLRVALVSLLVPLFTFVVFERWFLVALPKGPLEQFLGF